MSDKPEVSEDEPEKTDDVVADEELDDVAGGTVKAPVSPVRDPSFVSFPPQFIKVMPYHETDATVSNITKRSVSEIFDALSEDAGE